MLPWYLGVLHENVWLKLVDSLGQIRQYSLVDGGMSLRMELRFQKNRVIANYFFFFCGLVDQNLNSMLNSSDMLTFLLPCCLTLLL